MGTTRTKQNGTAPPDATPADVWRERAIHTVTGYSDSVLKMRVSGIATLLGLGIFPTHLVGLALLDLNHPRGSALALKEMMDDCLDPAKQEELAAETLKFAEYQRRIAAAVLVDPVLTYEEACSGEFPEDDIAMVADIVLRRTDTDAKGVRIGVEPLDRWATFHQEHGLSTEDCEHCLKLVQKFSSVDVGAV